MKDYASPVPTWKQPLTYLSLLLMGLGVGVGGSYLYNHSEAFARNLNLAQAQLTQPSTKSPDSNPVAILPATQPTNFVAQVVQEVGPAVVRINASRTVQTEVPEMFQDPFFRRFFGNQVPQTPNQKVERGTGSGFIVNADGRILTNAHVIDGADRVTVTLKDGRTLEGKVIGTDPVTDVAVVKIEAENLPTVKIGDAERLQVGEWAIAIGNPLGLNNTVTTGIISATGRSSSQIGVGDKRIDFIQTDAAINPGNSGGPLLNAKGEVIGMNTAIIANAQGLGFAIPINKAEDIAEELIAKGKVEHPYLGISMVALNPEVKQEIKARQGWTIAENEGVLIVKVMPNSPAQQASLQAGDIITAINGQPISDPSDVQQAVEQLSVGDRLSLTLNRKGNTLSLPVKVGVLGN
ncbi:MAG: HhoA/HhoB/HtrA family serine endopeptidase [Microcystaceae cyanobacterium]